MTELGILIFNSFHIGLSIFIFDLWLDKIVFRLSMPDEVNHGNKV